MVYPTLTEVEEATHTQLAKWWRFLPSPGASAVGKDRARFEEVLQKETYILEFIDERLTHMGGIDPLTSKTIGW